MIKQISTLLLLLCLLTSKAQLINTQPVEINIGPIHFNAALIKEQKVKRIDVVMVDKPDGKVIVDKGAGQGFEFDTQGRVCKYYYTIFKGIVYEDIDVPAVKRKGRIIQKAYTKAITKYLNDTIFASIYYDENDRIILKRTGLGDYYDAYYYEYNEKGLIKKEMHCKETNVSENKKEFKLGVQTVLSKESFEYENLTPTQVKKKCLNDEGREYKHSIINYNEGGKKTSENYNFIVSWMRSENVYEYDNRGFLIEQTYSSNESGEIKTEQVFEYDANGVLLSEKRLKNNELLNEISYLYDENKKLVKSYINRDHKNASIGIVKFAYSYY
ncbi:MAG: hypothetical protein J0L87_14395 [Bacteroidetes bacterium]|nr:hypothetical protein [Bacteroidota bacterium]